MKSYHFLTLGGWQPCLYVWNGIFLVSLYEIFNVFMLWFCSSFCSSFCQKVLLFLTFCSSFCRKLLLFLTLGGWQPCIFRLSNFTLLCPLAIYFSHSEPHNNFCLLPVTTSLQKHGNKKLLAWTLKHFWAVLWM